MKLTTEDMDKLGDTCKSFEKQWAGLTLDENDYILVRLDGKSFHTFTKGLARPYDSRLSQAMIDTMNFLIEKTHAQLGYTQSDEISLVYFKMREFQQTLYNNKIQKLSSVLASMATAKFNSCIQNTIPEKKDDFAFFDARVWSVDSLQEVSKVFLWRQEDAIKNAITMAASAYYSHKELMNKGSGVKLEMLKDKGVDFNTYPDFFTRGTFAFTDSFEIELTDDLELSDIAKEQNKRKNITTALRHKIVNDSFIRLKTLDSFDAVSAYLFDPIKKRYDKKMELKKAAKKANFQSP